MKKEWELFEKPKSSGYVRYLSLDSEGNSYISTKEGNEGQFTILIEEEKDEVDKILLKFNCFKSSPNFPLTTFYPCEFRDPIIKT